MITLVAMGKFHDKPPFVAWEEQSGIIRADVDGFERTYSSLTHLAGEHGCLLGDAKSIDPTN